METKTEVPVLTQDLIDKAARCGRPGAVHYVLGSLSVVALGQAPASASASVLADYIEGAD